MIFSNPALFTVMARQKKIIMIFQHAGAIKSFKAILPSDYGITKGVVFSRLVRNGILLPTQDGRYYLNESREKEVRKRRQDIIGIVLMVIAIMVLIAFFWQVV